MDTSTITNAYTNSVEFQRSCHNFHKKINLNFIFTVCFVAKIPKPYISKKSCRYTSCTDKKVIMTFKNTLEFRALDTFKTI